MKHSYARFNKLGMVFAETKVKNNGGRILKMKKITLLMTLFLFLTGTAWATIYTFDDTYKNWPGHFIDSRDEIGVPQIKDTGGVTVTIDGNNYLRSVVIIMKTGTRIPWDGGLGDGYFDALFINNDWNGTLADYESWDYYVEDDTQDINMDGTLYTVTSGYSYILAPSISGARTNHPAGIDGNDLVSTSGILAGVSWDSTNYTLTYTFNEGISITDKFVIGWSVWCANDVFLTQVPEPGILILLGIGLSAVGLVARRYKKI